MSVEGVWKLEMMGAYGWENVSTAFLKDGHYLGASADHFSTGSYEVADEAFTADLRVKQHGKVRTIFGQKKKLLSVRIEAKIKKADKIVGQARDAEGSKFDVKMRLIRLADLD
ncbi:MAG: hypothetical protein PVJ03_01755 [Chromatiaceae bacterium]|jgi:hypothetical protein